MGKAERFHVKGVDISARNLRRQTDFVPLSLSNQPNPSERVIIRSFTFNPFQTNTFIIHDDGEAVIIDASAHIPDELDVVYQYVDENNLTVKKLLLTHGHIDHIMGCAKLSEKYALPWYLNPADKPFVDRAQDQARLFGVAMDAGAIDTVPIREGDQVAFGNVEWEVVETPGHSPGSVSFIDRGSEVVISGDVLFSGSIGRTDLLHGSLPELMRSIFQKILTLPDNYRVLCGHGPDTTIGQERVTNPFLQSK